MRRALWQTLVDVLGAVGITSKSASGLRVSSFVMDLPMEITVLVTGDEEVLADVPRWRWRTDFDTPVSRLKISGHGVETGLAPNLPEKGSGELL